MTITAALHDGTQLKFPDGTAPEVIQRTVLSVMGKTQAEPPSESFTSGQNADLRRRSTLAMLQGPTMGFGDEILGGIVGGAKTLFNEKPLRQNYTEARDYVRGAVARQEHDSPVAAAMSQIVPSMMTGAALPQLIGKGGLMASALGSSIYGGLSGLVSGAGNSTKSDLGDIGADAGAAGMIGAVIPPVLLPVARAGGAVIGNIASRLSDSAAARYAKEKIAEAFVRDASPGITDPMMRAGSRLGTLGQEAVVADAGGASTRQLLDTLATLPGRTKQGVDAMIHDRIAGRGGRMIDSAEQALGTNGQRLPGTIESLMQQRQLASAPLYAKLHKMDVPADQELGSIIASAQQLGATKLGRDIAAGKRVPYTLDEDAINQSGQYSMRDLDFLKQALDTQIMTKGTNAATQRLTPLGVSLNELRSSLTNHLDGVTGGAYKAARDAFAGPSAIMDAANSGRRALTQDDSAISSLVRGMSGSELQGFRIGAFEALRQKLGVRSGQTQLQAMWAEPAMQEKLKAIFGNERSYREFASSVAAEARLKLLESTGRGSQTAARQFAAGDLDKKAMADFGGAAAAASTGAWATAGKKALDLWGTVKTPETVRDAMGQLLLSRGSPAQDGLLSLRSAADDLMRRRQIQSGQIGLLSPNLYPYGSGN